MRVLATLSILASSMLFTQPASAVEYPYSNGSGNVACLTDGQETGFFTVENGVVTSNSDCAGIATFPLGVTEIPDWRFPRASISSVIFPESLVRIGDFAFYSTQIVTLTIPNSVTALGGSAFREIPASSYRYCGSTLSNRNLGMASLSGKTNTCAPPIGALYNISSRSGDVACTSGYFTIENNVVTRNQDCAGSVNIPFGVSSIANYAFEYGTGITSVTIPDSVITIGISAFDNASSITSLTLGNGVTQILRRAFAGTRNLTSLTVPDSVISIGFQAFTYVQSLSSLTIGSSVTSIGDGAFSDANSLISLAIPDSVISIGNSAFSGPYALTSLTLGNSVTTIGGFAFNGIRSVEALNIPRSVTSIGQSAFADNPLSTFAYCGRTLETPDFENAGLGGGKTNTCTQSVTTPNAPTSIVATSTGATTASVAFTAPTDDGGSAITSYTAISTPGFITAVITQAESGTISVTGLTPRTAYTFRVVATNSIGDSYPSSPSNSVPEMSSSSSSNSSLATVSSGSVQNSQVATFSNGVTEAEIPATTALPAVKLTFTGSAPTAVTVRPLASNPAPLTATPFKVTTSTKIVEIQVTSGSFTGSATVCLDGAETDSVFHYTGGQWVELGSRSYSNGQICGVTTSFSPFTAAAANTNPNAPGSVVATATSKRSATVSFIAPVSDGGSVVTSYTAVVMPGSITKTLTQSGGGTFTFDNLQPSTSYTFTVTATNAIGTSSATTSNSIKLDALVPAALSAITFTDDGTGTAGKLTWSGKNIDAVLYTGPANSYPGPFNFGAFSTSWNGTIRNLTPETEYTVSIFAISSDGVGESKSLTFKTDSGVLSDAPIATAQTSSQLNQIISWVNQNTFVPGEAANINSLLTKFDALVTSAHRSYLKVPTSRVSKVEVKSLTPKACSVVSATAKVDAGLITALTKDTCTISYTVSGASRAWATFVKDFTFKKVSK